MNNATVSDTEVSFAASPYEAFRRSSGVLQLCDGKRTVEDIAGELSRAYDAPKDQILADVASMLQELADKGVVKA